MKNKDIMLLLISAFIIIIAWITFNIYHNYVTSTLSESLSINIAQISPNFDTKTIDALKKREVVTPIYSLPNKNFMQIQNASPSAKSDLSQNSTQQATQEGDIKL